MVMMPLMLLHSELLTAALPWDKADRCDCKAHTEIRHINNYEFGVSSSQEKEHKKLHTNLILHISF